MTLTGDGEIDSVMKVYGVLTGALGCMADCEPPA